MSRAETIPEAAHRRSRPAADVVVTMGCGDAWPVYPCKRYEDWEVGDPAEATLDEVRAIRDEIDARIQHLLGQVRVGAAPVSTPS
jgi:ArsR family transcriptional regulator